MAEQLLKLNLCFLRGFSSARRLVGDRLYFISNLSDRMSLYAMDKGGSVPEPLLPPDIALQNRSGHELTHCKVFPHLGKIMVMIDRDGDENYQPMWVTLTGGIQADLRRPLRRSAGAPGKPTLSAIWPSWKWARATPSWRPSTP